MKPHYSFKYSFLLILFYCFSFSLSGQYQTYVNPLTRTLDKTNAKVGTLPGSVVVNSLGAATYEIPVIISPGSAGMQPSLSIVYNSRNGDGILGMGWSLAGLSEITRVPKNFYLDNHVDGIDLQNTDMFALDNNRLIMTAGSSYGADNSEYATEFETFVKVIAHGTSGTGPSWFEVSTKDGNTIEYGNSTDSKVEAYGNSTVYMWRINKVTDQNGNTIKFIYNEVNGESYISRIDYTTNETAGIITPYNSIIFEYATRTDINSKYVGGSKIPETVLLTLLRVETENSEQVRKYQFKYFLDSFNKTFLNEIIEYGSDNTFFNSTVIGWGGLTSQFLSGDAFNNSTINNYYSGDFNGDGRTDIVVTPKKTLYTSSDKWRLYLANPDGTGFTFKNEGSLNSYFHGFTVVDVDGNGNDDILWKDYRTFTYPCAEVIFPGEGENSISGKNESSKALINPNRIRPPGECFGTSVSFFNYSYNESTGLIRGDSNYDILFEQNTNGSIYLVPDDLDGNGKADYLVLDQSKSLNCVRINGLNRSGMSFSTADEVRILDFDGEGRKEVLVIKDNNSYIYQYSTSSEIFSTIYTSATYPTTDHRIFPGDFNGDKKTDILSWKSGIGWELNYSTGTGFVASANIPSLTNSDPNASLTDYNYYCADFNGDEKDDILEAYKYGASSIIRIFYSRGDGVFNLEFNSFSKSSIDQDYFNFGDFNGDGKRDIFFYDYSLATNYVNICFFHKDELKNLVSSITNGLNFKTLITYDRLSSGSAFYVKYSNATFPVYDFSGAFYVVSKIETDNGLGQYIPILYTWDGAKEHRQGKSFLGFSKMSETFAARNSLTIKIFELHPTFHFNNLKTGITINTVDINDTVSILTNTLSIRDYGNNRIFPYVSKQISVNKLIKTTNIATSQYDDFGNLERVKTVYKNDEVGYGVEAVKSSTNEYHQYGNNGIPNKLTYKTDSSTYTNEPSFVRKMQFTYDNKGNLLTEKSDPGKAKEVTKTNSSFNSFGLPQQTTISAPGLASRTTVFEYDAKGRFVTKVTDPSGNFISKSYYPGAGDLYTETSIAGLTTTFIYDGFGRILETITPQSNHITKTYNWDPYQINHTLYNVMTDAPGIPFVKYFYDILGRETYSTAETPGGITTSENYYNSSFQLYMKILPFLEEESIKSTSFIYDNYGRIERESYLDKYTQYTYNAKTIKTCNWLNGDSSDCKSTKGNSLGNVLTSAEHESTVTNSYNSMGQVKQMNAEGTILSFYYDEFGRQDSTINPNSGTTRYVYNAFGELTSQTDANNNTVSLEYDNLGRINIKSGPEGNTSYIYVQNGNGKGLVESVTGPNGISQSYNYDTYGRPVQFTQTIPGDQSFTTSFGYDSWNNNTSITYPSGISIINVFNNGYLDEIKKSDGSTIWKLDSINGLGQPTLYTFGSPDIHRMTRFRYNDFGYLTNKWLYKYDQTYNFDVLSGNLMERTYWQVGKARVYESFSYSGNNLASSTVTGQTPVTVSYDQKGNITSKTGIGIYGYNINKLDSISSESTILPLNHQIISYTSENYTSNIVQDDSLELQFLYSPDNQRIKTILLIEGDTSKIKYYSPGYEKVVSNSSTKEYSWINSPFGPVAVIIKEGSTETLYYLETDHLGSIIALLNSSGFKVESYSYDAWGRRRNPTDWCYNNVPTPTLIDRGFTSHEHLDEFGLINMNGRMYDPYTGRFLSVDPIIQFPGNAQSFNGYGYCLNNPLSYSDPSGMLPVPMSFNDNGYYNPEGAAWLANYYSQSFGGGGGGVYGGRGYYYDSRNEVYRNGKGQIVDFDEYYDNKIASDLAKFRQEFFSVSINFKGIKQIKEHWCAFAASAAIFQYYGIKIDQATLANAYYKANKIALNSDEGASWRKSEGYDDDFLRQFFYDYEQNKYLYTGIGSRTNVPSIYSIRDHLNNRHVILSNINEGFGEINHAIIIIGMSATQEGIRLKFFDPGANRDSWSYPAYSNNQRQTIAIWGVNVNPY